MRSHESLFARLFLKLICKVVPQFGFFLKLIFKVVPQFGTERGCGWKYGELGARKMELRV